MSARAKPPAMPDAGQLALLDSIAERHPYRGVVKYCRRIKKGVRLTCSEDLWNVTMLCAWEHAFGEYREAVAISRLLDGYVFESYRYWGQVRWTYGLVAEAWHRLGEPGRAEETVARIMEHENPNYTTGDSSIATTTTATQSPPAGRAGAPPQSPGISASTASSSSARSCRATRSPPGSFSLGPMPSPRVSAPRRGSRRRLPPGGGKGRRWMGI